MSSHPVGDSVAVAVRRDANVLFVRRAGTDPWTGIWWLPGGGRDASETLADAATRELWEETALTVTANDLERLTSVVATAPTGSRRRFTLFAVDAPGRAVQLNEENDAATWKPPAYFLSQPLGRFRQRSPLMPGWIDDVAVPFIQHLDSRPR